MQSDRRSFFDVIGRGMTVLFAGLFGAIAGKAATRVKIGQVSGTPNSMAGFDGSGQGISVTVGNGLNLSGGTLTATGASIPVRQHNVALVREASGAWTLPPAVQRNTVIHRNGVRQQPSVDYNIVGEAVVPTGAAWPVDDTITADGEPA